MGPKFFERLKSRFGHILGPSVKANGGVKRRLRNFVAKDFGIWNALWSVTNFNQEDESMNRSRSIVARPVLYVFRGRALLLLVYPLRHAADQPPSVGTAAPDFKLTSQEGAQVSLKDFRGKWVVLYFYPKDFTTGCTIEAHNFQRDLAQYEQIKTVILGLSVDTVDSHQQFCTKEGLSFKL